MPGVKYFVKWFAGLFLLNLLGVVCVIGAELAGTGALGVIGNILTTYAGFISLGLVVLSYFRAEKKKRREMGDMQYEIEKQKKRDAARLSAEKRAAQIGVMTGTATPGEKEKLRRIRELEARDRQARQGGGTTINGKSSTGRVFIRQHSADIDGESADLSQYGIEDSDNKRGVKPVVVAVLAVVLIALLIYAVIGILSGNELPPAVLFGG